MVTVRDKAFADERILFLAALLECDIDSALGRMTRLWKVCADLQTDRPEVRFIRAALRHPLAERHLVDAGLGDDQHRDPALAPGVVRVRGCNEADWHETKAEQEAVAELRKDRAALAPRDASGRWTAEPHQSAFPPHLAAENRRETVCGDDRSSSLSPDSGSSSDSSSPELPESGDKFLAERGGASSPAAPVARPPALGSDARRATLATDAWNYAAKVHARLKPQIDPHTRNCWSGTNIAEPRRMLSAIVADLTQGQSPNWEAAWDTIRNRIDVAGAAAERDARAGLPSPLRWFTPTRMWDAQHFAKDAESTPEQAAQPRNTSRFAGGGVPAVRRIVSRDDDTPPLPPAAGGRR